MTLLQTSRSRLRMTSGCAWKRARPDARSPTPRLALPTKLGCLELEQLADVRCAPERVAQRLFIDSEWSRGGDLAVDLGDEEDTVRQPPRLERGQTLERGVIGRHASAHHNRVTRLRPVRPRRLPPERPETMNVHEIPLSARGWPVAGHANQQTSVAAVAPARLARVSPSRRCAADRTAPAKRCDQLGEYGIVGSSAKAPIRLRRWRPEHRLGMNISLLGRLSPKREAPHLPAGIPAPPQETSFLSADTSGSEPRCAWTTA